MLEESWHQVNMWLLLTWAEAHILMGRMGLLPRTLRVLALGS
jgi:hypothetical protein